MLDPVARKLALAPIDDEPFTEEDRRAVAEADEWLKHNNPIPMETVLADFGLTMADWEDMAKTPLSEEYGKPAWRHLGWVTKGTPGHPPEWFPYEYFGDTLPEPKP